MRWRGWPPLANWFGRHLPSIVLIPLGLALIAAGIHLAAREGIAIALLVLGSGSAILGSFSSRLEGQQELGLKSLKFNLRSAIQTTNATTEAAVVAAKATVSGLRLGG